MLSNGKPLKGILKHRRHTDTKTHQHSERTVGVLESMAETSTLNETESSEKPTNTDSIVDDGEPVALPHSGKLCAVYSPINLCMHTYVDVHM